jgi:hypothetical protein
MQQKTRKLIQIFGLLTSLVAATEVFAGSPGGVVVYAPVAHSIPTLTDLMLVMLGLLTAVIAYRVLRAHPGGQPLASLAVLAIAGVTMIPGAKFIEHAYAVADLQNVGGDRRQRGCQWWRVTFLSSTPVVETNVL